MFTTDIFLKKKNKSKFCSAAFEPMVAEAMQMEVFMCECVQVYSYKCM